MVLAHATHHLTLIETAATLLADSEEVYVTWRRLVQQCQLQGVRAHDAKLVASMVSHSVNSIVTFNTADFRRYSEIEVIDPERIDRELVS